MDTPLTARLASVLGQPAGRAYARGSTGLYALLRALAERDGPGEVVIPTLCCETVAIAAVLAGHTVVWADVSPLSLCCTPATVEPLMSAHTRAVLVVHLYGIDAQVERFAPLRARFPQAVFVEDIAHALGGLTRDGLPLGRGLDCTLASFAASKIVPGDGGALLWNTPSLQVLEQAGPVDTRADRVDNDRLALSLRNLVHALADLWRENAGRPAPTLFASLVPGYQRLIVAPGSVADATAALDGLDRLDSIRQRRHARYRHYADGITSAAVTVPDLHAGSTCWRCPLVFESARLADTVTARLRAQGIPASNHYFPLSVLFGAEPCPEGESVARRIVNLWVDDSLTHEQAQQTIALINRT